MEPTRSVELGRDVLTSIYLDYGADAQECNFSDLNVSERGMVFKSPWQFSVGAQLALVFSYKDLFGRSIKAEAEGLVVDSEAASGGGFLHMLIFPDISPELKTAIRDLQRGRQSGRELSLN
jgi:hypothetical protein